MSHWQQEDISKRYEAGERTVQPAALRVIELSGVLTASSPRIVLDNACGTGVVTALLHEKATWGETDRIVAGDFSESMVKGLKERIEGMKWLNTEAKVADAQVTKLPSSHFTHVLTNFGIMLLPKPDDGLNEITRILKPGGVTSFSCPIEPGWPSYVNDAIDRLEGCPKLGHPREIWCKTGLWHDEDWLKTHLMELGFTDIRTEKFSFTAEMQELKGFLGMFTFVVPIVSSASGWTDAQQKEWTPRVLQEAEKVIVERHGDGVISFPFTTLTTVATKPLE